MQIHLTAEARRLVERIKTDRGVGKAEAIARILQWFTAQDARVQRAILDRDGDAASELAKLKLAELAGGHAATGFTLPGATAAIRQLCDQIDRVATGQAAELQERLAAEERGRKKK